MDSLFECPLCRYGLDQLDTVDAVRVGRSHASLVVALRRRVVGLCGGSDGRPSWMQNVFEPFGLRYYRSDMTPAQLIEELNTKASLRFM